MPLRSQLSDSNIRKIVKTANQERANTNYKITRKVLGSGQSGVVKVAERKTDGKKFAVKIPVGIPELITSMIMSAQGVGPEIEDFFTSKGKLHMVMEMLNGMELTDLIENTDISITETQAVALADKIEMIHDLGFLHNDLGTINVYAKMTNDKIKELIVIDFDKTIRLSNPAIDYRNLIGTIKSTAIGSKKKNMKTLMAVLKRQI